MSLILESAVTDVIKGAAAAVTAAPAKAAALEPDKREQVGVDRFRVGGRHAVWEALVSLERSVFQEFGRVGSGIGVRHDLIVIAVHHEHRHD